MKSNSSLSCCALTGRNEGLRDREREIKRKEREREITFVIPCILSYIKLVLIVEQTKKLCVYHQLLIFLKLQLMFNRLRAKGVLLDF